MPLGLVAIALLGSVLIPARQTWVITNLLRETTDVIAPSRVRSAELQSGLAEEMGTLQSYALSGDGLWLHRHEAVIADNDRRMATLDSLGRRVAGPFKSHVATARERVAAWRLWIRVPDQQADDRRELARAIQTGQRHYDASRAAVADLSSDLSTEAALRNDRVRELEHFSLLSNAAMVLAAFVALSAVLVLTVRERRSAVSLRRRVEEESARARREEALLEEAMEGRQRLQSVMTSRSRLMRGFSHDVKNPIGAADGYAELLDEGVYGELNAGQRESIARMRRCMRGALALIDDLHELGRAETGHLELAPEAVDVSDLVRKLAEEYQATAEASGLSLVVSSGTDIPLILTSKTRVRQIASNLVSNAIKYTDAGAVTLSVVHRSLAQNDESREWVLIEVADTGRGIAPDQLDYIFQEFGRVAGTQKPGAGLGLAISRLLAQALGGQITVTSEIGRGSTFTLWLPLVPASVEGWRFEVATTS
jgi:signal transduction histidine kinase